MGARAEDVVFERGLKLETLSAVLTGPFTVVATMPPILSLDPNGTARSVVMPAEATSRGQVFLIANNSGTTGISLNIRDSGDTTTLVALTSGATKDLNETAVMFCDGIRWWGVSATNP
jgi:hypothetical protein